MSRSTDAARELRYAMRPYDRGVHRFKRYDAAQDPAATNFIPVARAAALLHERMFPGHPVKEVQTLDRLAQALAAVVPLYLRHPESGALRALDKTAIARGRFTRGATRLEFDIGAPVRFLLVSRLEFETALDSLTAIAVQ